MPHAFAGCSVMVAAACGAATVHHYRGPETPYVEIDMPNHGVECPEIGGVLQLYPGQRFGFGHGMSAGAQVTELRGGSFVADINWPIQIPTSGEEHARVSLI